MKLSEEKLELWKQHIADQEKSGLPVAKYCRQHNLKVHQFKYYRSRLSSKTKKTPHFIPVQVKKKEMVKLEIAGVEVGITSDISQAWLAKLILEVGKNAVS